MISSSPAKARRLPFWLLALALFLTASLASAAGRIQWKDKTLKERDKTNWRVELAIFLPRAPDVAHVPMKFEFQPIAYYERTMVDGDKVVERVVPLEHRQSLIESVDVGFLDSSSGKIESRTRFSFKVTRAHGYEAGEYKVTIRDSRNGQTVGTPTTLKFEGENEIIDRRSIVFTGEKKKKKPEEGGGAAAKEGGEGAKEGGDSGSADKEGGDQSSDASSDSGSSSESGAGDEGGSEDDALAEGDDGPPPIEEKPGGCGCRLHSNLDPNGALALGAAGLGAMLLRRRRAQPRA